jgi:hypothetical protein
MLLTLLSSFLNSKFVLHCPFVLYFIFVSLVFVILALVFLFSLYIWSLGCVVGVLPTRTPGFKTYRKEWKDYVAANLHFYTTLLACFLR